MGARLVCRLLLDSMSITHRLVGLRMDYEKPDRYQLEDPNGDSCGPTAKMEPSRDGGYVSIASYHELLLAYQEKLGLLARIADIAS